MESIANAIRSQDVGGSGAPLGEVGVRQGRESSGMMDGCRQGGDHQGEKQ